MAHLGTASIQAEYKLDLYTTCDSIILPLPFPQNNTKQDSLWHV